MALNGPEALRSLDDALHDIRREESDIGKRLSRSSERTAKLHEAEAEHFQALAKLRSELLLNGDSLKDLTDAERSAQEMLSAHADELEEMETELSNLDRAIADKASERHKVLEELDGAQEELAALSKRIEQSLTSDDAYAKARQMADRLQSVTLEANRKLEQAELDKEQKGKPYREDPLFMYLWERGYDTRHYRANPVVSWADGKVAELVRYTDARANFSVLNEIPIRLREHAKRQEEMLAAAEHDIEAIEAQAIDTAGGKAIREKISAAQARLDAFDEDMHRMEDERDEKAHVYRKRAEGRDPAFEQAMEQLAQSMQASELAGLYAQARATATPEDDALIAKIEDIRTRIAEEALESSEHKARLKVLAKRRRELEDIEYEFKRARYDDPRSVFREENLSSDLLNDFLRGAVTAGTYWAAWQRSQNWKPDSSNWGAGFGLPRHGRSRQRNTSDSPWQGGNAPGGFSRPRTGSRGSRRHGGFKTGGGF